MGLRKATTEEAVSHMTEEERSKWEHSLCKDCKLFNFFWLEEYEHDGYKFPVYFSCRNQTGCDFVKEMFLYSCSFHQSKK